MTVYTVGPATALALTKLHFSTILGADTGNGGTLANLIVHSYRRDHSMTTYSVDVPDPSQLSLPLLFLVGDQRRDIIPKRLAEENIPLEELVVYETSVASTFDEELDRVVDDTTDGEIEWIIFFSPSGAEVALKKLERMAHRIKVATIGPTTEEYLRTKWNVSPDMVSAKPEPISMVKGIMEHSI
jgi:uroporphyrinogen-III synthase